MSDLTYSAAEQTLDLLENLPQDQIDALAKRWRRANTGLIAVINHLGGRLERRFAQLPAGLRNQVQNVTESALEKAYHLAAKGDALPVHGARSTMLASVGLGAAGGMAGLAGALAELPLTITLLLRAIRQEAEAQGFDPNDPWIMAQALRCFSSGSPLEADDGLNTAFLSARITLTGPALQRLIAAVAPKLAVNLGQKLAAQTIPVLGAVTGATINAAYMQFYREMSAIRFSLLRLSQEHGASPVLDAFAQATGQRQISNF